MRISNPQSIFAQNQLSNTTKAMQKLTEQMASLKRINRAQDGAAELAIATKMNAQIRGLEVAKNNAMQGQAAMKIAEGTFSEINEIVTKQRDLALQGANDTLTSEERAKIQVEYNALTEEIKRIAGNATFNTMNVVDQAASSKFGVGGSHLQIGANTTASDSLTVSYTGINTSSLAAKSFTDAASFKTAADECDTLLKSLATDRTAIGVQINRLDHTINNIGNMLTNQTEAYSTIMDLDTAKAGADAVKLQIQQQSNIQVMQLINSLPASIMQLLQL